MTTRFVFQVAIIWCSVTVLRNTSKSLIFMYFFLYKNLECVMDKWCSIVTRLLVKPIYSMVFYHTQIFKVCSFRGWAIFRIFAILFLRIRNIHGFYFQGSWIRLLQYLISGHVSMHIIYSEHRPSEQQQSQSCGQQAISHHAKQWTNWRAWHPYLLLTFVWDKDSREKWVPHTGCVKLASC